MLQIHEKLRVAREKAGLTQDELAARLGIERSTYQYWETKTPSIDKIKRVAVALKLAEDYFFVTKDEDFVAAVFNTPELTAKYIASLEAQIVFQQKEILRLESKVGKLKSKISSYVDSAPDAETAAKLHSLNDSLEAAEDDGF